MDCLDYSIKDFFRKSKKTLNKIYEILDNNGLIFKSKKTTYLFKTLTTTMVVYFFYINSHFFLFGYYSDDYEVYKPFLEILTNPDLTLNTINFKLTVVVGVFLFCVLFFATLILPILYKKNNIEGLIIFSLVHILTTYFFIGVEKINLSNLLLFLLFWLLPFSLLIFIKYINIIVKNFFATLIGFFTTMNISYFIISFFNYFNYPDCWELIFYTSIPLLIMLITLLFDSKIENKNEISLFTEIDISLFIGIIIKRLFFQSFSSIVVIFMITVVVFFIMKKSLVLKSLKNQLITETSYDEKNFMDKITFLIIRISKLKIRELFILLLIGSYFLIIGFPSFFLTLGYFIRSIIK